MEFDIVTWFGIVKNTWQNVLVDHREVLSIVLIHGWGLAVYLMASLIRLLSVIFPCNDQGGIEVKGVAHVSEMITHSSCRCSSNVVVLLESNPKLSGCLAILNHVTKRPTPSLDKDYAIKSKACALHKFWILWKKPDLFWFNMTGTSTNFFTYTLSIVRLADVFSGCWQQFSDVCSKFINQLSRVWLIVFPAVGSSHNAPPTHWVTTLRTAA